MASHYRRGKYWWISYYDNGKSVRHVLKTEDGRKVQDEKMAKYLKNAIENELSKGQSPLINSNISAEDALSEYMEHSKHLKAATTQTSDYSILKNFIKSSGIKRISEINTDLVLKNLNGRIQSGQINKITANNTIKVLKAWLNFCVKRQYVRSNLLENIPKYPVDVLPPKFLSKEEVSNILKAAEGESLYAAIMTAVYTGMRLGELKRLKWEDIDMAAGSITIREAKSGYFRVVPLHPQLRAVLNSGNVPLDFRNHLKNFKRIREVAGVKCAWHSFRHTFASTLAQSGKVNIYKISKYLGHADVKTTQIYAHLIPDSKDILALDYCA